MGFKYKRFDPLYKVVSCTPAEVRTFHSQRKVLIPAVPGCLIYVTAIMGVKEAGPAFVLNFNNFEARYNNTAKSVAAAVGNGFLDATAAACFYSPNTTATVIGGNEANAANPAGKAILSGISDNQDITGEGSPLVFIFLYQLIPANFRNVAAIEQPRPAFK